MRTKLFFEPVLKSEVRFVTDCSGAELRDWAKKHPKYLACLDKLPVDGLDGCTSNLEMVTDVEPDGGLTTHHFLWIRVKNQFYSLLHETVHLTGQVFHERGIPILKENDEMFAYYQEYWFKILWRFMNKKHPKGGEVENSKGGDK